MPATQISFAAFAASLLASSQSEATDCTPPVQEAAIAVVAHPLTVDGGECSCFLSPQVASDLAMATVDSHGGFSNGAYVLLNLSHAQGGTSGCLSNSVRVQAFDRLLLVSSRVIGAGC